MRRQQNYGNERQYVRARKQTRRLRTLLGRVIRDIERKSKNASEELLKNLETANRLHEHRRDSKNKIYSIHEPQVQCIAKGKVHQKYEFGNKAGFVTIAKSNWIIGSLGFKTNKYDGHTLEKNLKQAERITKKGI